jgi:TolB-like protein/class 3 adenylate cyclase/Tfp pilus assembly protein PilF
MERRLAAILSADVVGYSRLMEQDEAGTLATLKERRSGIIEPLVREHGGRVVKLMGDGVLVALDSAVQAVACAVAIQKRMAAANVGTAGEKHIVLRIGVNLGDVIVEGNDLYGDGVNVATRLQAMAEPGRIWIAGNVHDESEKKLPLAYDDLGLRDMKNIMRPVRCYRVADGADPIAGTGAIATTAKPSIAVLPLTNMSGDPGQQYFSDGITEDIITELSRFRQLHVVARNTSFRYRGSDIDMIRAGRELGAHYLLEGSVRRLASRVRITAQLIDAKTGHHLWAERFDRSEEDIFAVQDQVVRTIVGTLMGRLQAAGAERAGRKPPASLAAYECVLRADALPYDDPDAEAEARRLYEKAIQLDPSYARAYALLASLTQHQWLRDMGPSDDALDQALDLAKKAVHLDQDDHTCQGILGLMHLLLRSFELAEHHYLKALERNPNSSTVVAAVGYLYAYLGKPQQSIGYFEEAKLLDPYFNPTWYWPELGIAHFVARRYEDAIAAFNRSSSMSCSVNSYLAVCHALSGAVERARHHAAEVMRLAPDFSIARFVSKEPFRNPADSQCLTDGLRRAGLPE